MKKRNLAIFITIIIILIVVLVIVAINSNKKDTNEEEQKNKVEQNEQSKLKTFNFSNAYGEISIEAENALSARGTAGASNYIFYLKDNKLYLYNHQGEDDVYADGVNKIYYDEDSSETIKVELNESSTLHKRSPYIEYK